jgi:hypothetical protein
MKKPTCLLMLLFAATLAFSQSATPMLTGAAGGHYENASYRLDWSAGEPVTATLSSGNTLLTQGFHQNNYVVTALDAFAGEESAIAVYPNPARDFVTLEIADYKAVKSLEWLTLTSATGKVVKKQEITQTQMRLNFSGYPPGIYLLEIQHTSQRNQTFKIIKK